MSDVVDVKFGEKYTDFNIKFEETGRDGAPGGYYVPKVANGVLSWEKSKSSLPDAENANVKGDQGVPGVSPEIQNGTWWIWSVSEKKYVDTGVSAAGYQPIPKAETGTWWVWDPEIGAYADTGESYRGESSGGGGSGTTFFPSVDEMGNLTWTNDAGLENPEPRNITGPQGLPGIYLGSGDMPEGYSVQLDPEGEADGSFEELVESVAKALEEEGGGEGGGTTETDPTVPDWAKTPEKPSYAAEEVGAIPTPTTAEVGQTIVVSEVDEDGKPTKWEVVSVYTTEEIDTALGAYITDIDTLVGGDS